MGFAFDKIALLCLLNSHNLSFGHFVNLSVFVTKKFAKSTQKLRIMACTMRRSFKRKYRKLAYEKNLRRDCNSFILCSDAGALPYHSNSLLYRIEMVDG